MKNTFPLNFVKVYLSCCFKKFYKYVSKQYAIENVKNKDIYQVSPRLMYLKKIKPLVYATWFVPITFWLCHIFKYDHDKWFHVRRQKVKTSKGPLDRGSTCPKVQIAETTSWLTSYSDDWYNKIILLPIRWSNEFTFLLYDDQYNSSTK